MTAAGTILVTTAAWLSTPEGQKAIADGASAIYSGIEIADEAVTKATKAATAGIVAGAEWIGKKTSDAWKWAEGLLARVKVIRVI